MKTDERKAPCPYNADGVEKASRIGLESSSDRKAILRDKLAYGSLDKRLLSPAFAAVYGSCPVRGGRPGLLYDPKRRKPAENLPKILLTQRRDGWPSLKGTNTMTCSRFC